MYQIYADNILIYDSTLSDYKIGKGLVSLETNKSGSFVFSVYPDHFFYDSFVRLKTVIKVLRSGKILFRGRILNDVTDYWNNKVITCEGELGFLQDSIIRPFSFSGSPENLFKKFVNDHNSQVDDFKKFKIGTVTVVDGNNYIARENTDYETTIDNLNSRLIEDSLGGYFYITHGEDGTEEIPTLNYLADFTKVSSQLVEFGSNLKDYTKTITAENIATAIIPLGAEVDDGKDDTADLRLTIASVNNGKDYVYNAEAVALYGWIFKTVEWDDVTDASNLLKKANDYLDSVINQNVTIELNAIDLHLLDRNIESFNVGDYIRVVSKPHKFDSTLLCNKQSIDLLKPDNDTLTLGYTYSTFTENTNKTTEAISTVKTIRTSVSSLSTKLSGLSDSVSKAQTDASTAINDYNSVVNGLSDVSGDVEAIAGVVTDNARNIATNAENTAINAENIAQNTENISIIFARLQTLENEASNYLALGINVTELSNVDLDNYKDPGNYKVTSGSLAKTVQNIPEAIAGRLIVMVTTIANRVVQIYITNSAVVRVYTRYFDGGVWKTWTKFNNS